MQLVIRRLPASWRKKSLNYAGCAIEIVDIKNWIEWIMNTLLDFSSRLFAFPANQKFSANSLVKPLGLGKYREPYLWAPLWEPLRHLTVWYCMDWVGPNGTWLKTLELEGKDLRRHGRVIDGLRRSVDSIPFRGFDAEHAISRFLPRSASLVDLQGPLMEERSWKKLTHKEVSGPF